MEEYTTKAGLAISHTASSRVAEEIDQNRTLLFLGSPGPQTVKLLNIFLF